MHNLWKNVQTIHILLSKKIQSLTGTIQFSGQPGMECGATTVVSCVHF